MLLLLWVVLYSIFGILFSVVFCFLPNTLFSGQNFHSSVLNFADGIYFSFITLSTLGYGDIYPASMNAKLVAAFEPIVGVALNAVMLGVVVTKILHRPDPVRLSKHLVFDLSHGQFWFRYIHNDPDPILNGTYQIKLTIPMAEDEAVTASYDRRWAKVKSPHDHFVKENPLDIIAVKTESISIAECPSVGFGSSDVCVTPLHFSFQGTTVTFSITAYKSETNDFFVSDKTYTLNDVRCGSFESVSNVLRGNLTNSRRRKLIRERIAKFDSIISTPIDRCKECAIHEHCLLDVATKAKKQTSDGIKV